MGQYHLVVNLDKQQYLHPHRLGDGLKLLEFGCSSGGTMTGLALLLAASNGRGGGDADENPVVGSWAGDRIAILGDYCEPGDIPGFTDQHTEVDASGNVVASTAYDYVEDNFEEVSPNLLPLIAQADDVVFYQTDYGTVSRAPRWSTRGQETLASITPEQVIAGKLPERT